AILSSARTAQIVGAGAYGLAREPGAGESRLGNAAGAVVGFSLFELGGSLSNPLSSALGRAGVRLATGAVGGAAQLATSSLVANGKMTSGEDALRAGIAGGAFNFAMPAVQELVEPYFSARLPAKAFVASEVLPARIEPAIDSDVRVAASETATAPAPIE